MKSLGQAGAVVAMLTFASGAMAATHIGTPAELPPDDFAGRQFVDSAGCVFIRATVDGAVTWVPRLTVERPVLCAFGATFTEGAVVAEGSLPTPAPDLPPKVDAETAEALAAITLNQLARPGAPVLYGTFTGHWRHSGRGGISPFITFSPSQFAGLCEAVTMAGATELENRYGRERWRSSATTSLRAAV